MTPTAMAWIDHHARGAPPALAARVRDVLAGAAASERAGERRNDESVPEQLIDVATATLRDLLQDEQMTRAHALDLLTADALVTFAFEAAADQPATLAARTDDAMRRIALLAVDP